MSLSVSVYLADAERRMINTLTDKPWENPDWELLSNEDRLARLRNSRRPSSAGPESWRKKVWGSELLIGLGLHLLPSLAANDIYAIDNDLNVLHDEIETVAQHVDDIAKIAGCFSQEITRYLESIADAIENAKRINGGVVIW